MKRILIFLMLLPPLAGHSQRLDVKTNLLYDATTTMNLGLEARLASCATLEVAVSYNPWTFSDHRQWKILLVQPEYRYWLRGAFDGHFFGAHLHGGQFNINRVDAPFGLWPELKEYNYQGEFYGAGLSWGYRWRFSPRWGLEATLGAGYARVNYDKYTCVVCGDKVGSGHKNYWGPTKAGISLIFNIF